MMPREMLLRGQRCKNAKQMKAYGHDYVGLRTGTYGITPAILAHAIKHVWGACYPGRSPSNVVGSLCHSTANG